MKRLSIIIILSLALGTNLVKAQAQTLELNFPKLGERMAWIYSFAGSRVDSFSVVLDAQGKAHVPFPKKDYRGVGYLYIPQAGGSEFVLAEPTLKIASAEEKFNGATLQFPQSSENALMQRKLNVLIDTAPLYAKRYLELIDFMQRLYAAVQSADRVAQEALLNEIQYRLDINALYTAGNLWTDVHTYYADLADESAYAASVEKTLMRLQEPVRTAFFASAISAADRINRHEAVMQMVKNYLQAYPNQTVTDPKLERILNLYRVETGKKAPAPAGLEKPLTQPAVLIFFDSNCDHCRHELEWLTAHYKDVQAKGYRVISIAADTEQNSYLNAAAAFAWDKADRLCDYKGFAGENFKNYGIIGTPTIFTLDKDGVVTGKYAKMEEIF